MTLRPMKKQHILLLTIVLSLAVFALYYLFFSERIDTVIKGRIYRSAQLSSSGLQKLIEEKGIRTIINLRGGFKDSEWHVKEREIAEKNSVRLYDIALSPHNLPEYSAIQLILDVLSRSERPVLIHCRRGADRTGLVSALALAIEQDAPFAELKKQFSWRYGVFPFYRSIGPFFFSRYEQWLERTHSNHDREALISWIRNEYVDGRGNLQYWIDGINGMTVRDRKAKVMITGAQKNIVVDGWAFDSRNKGPAVGLTVYIGKRVSSRADFLYNRPDVARHFGFGEEYYETFPVGWRAEFDTGLIGKGCHDISLKLLKSGSEPVEIPSDYEVCF
jgi:protein tyrosine phosphatase (PTP) superfamily phosphohydrolase (DUF442 family)